MGGHRVEVTAISEGSPETVWRLLADVSTWSSWGPWDETTRVRDGAPSADGVGAIRHLRRGRWVSVEEVVAFEAPRRLAYELREGLPLNDYHVEVGLVPAGSGTLIHWEATFDGSNPLIGGFLHLGLSRFIGYVANELARAAEAESLAPAGTTPSGPVHARW